MRVSPFLLTNFIVSLLVILESEGSHLLQEDGVIYVGNNGTDDLTCLNGGIQNPCRSLSYLLLDITSCGNNECNIILLDDQFLMQNYTTVVTKALNITSFSTRDHVVSIQISQQWNLTGSSSVNVYLSRLTFTVISEYYGLNIKSFNSANLNEIFIKSSNQNKSFEGLIYFYNVISLIFVSFNISPSTSGTLKGDGVITVSHVNSLSFSDCFFMHIKFSHSNDGVTNLPLLSLSQVTSASFNNCLFRSNAFSRAVVLLNIEFVSFTNCNFEGNNIHSLLYVIFCKRSLTIADTNFTNNHATDVHIFPGSILKLQNCCPSNSIKNVKFYRNYMVLIDAFIYDTLLGNFTVDNVNVTENQAHMNLIHFYSIDSQLVLNMNMNLRNLFVENNSIPIRDQDDQIRAVLLLPNTAVTLMNSTFINNLATPLATVYTNLSLSGKLLFKSNRALRGGGIYFDYDVILGGNAQLSFINNVAGYGGAIYISGGCLYTSVSNQNLVLVFSGNSARRKFGGANIYSEDCGCERYIRESIKIQSDNKSELIVAYPTLITQIIPSNSTNSAGNGVLQVYPGKELDLLFNITDCNGINSECTADVFLGCDTGIYCDPELTLSGPTSVLLFPNLSVTGLWIESLSKNFEGKKFKLLFICRDTPVLFQNDIGYNMSIKLTACPFGMNFDSEENICKCNIENNRDFICSEKQGTTCIRSGYWAGNYNHGNGFSFSISHPCHYCKHSIPCPSKLSSDSSKFRLLPEEYSDDQCRDGRGGTLCMYCASDKTFTYLVVKCIPKEKCSHWHPYFLLLMCPLFTIFIGAMLLVSIKVTSTIGSGYLHGPLFYLAVLSQLPLRNINSLSIVVHAFTATYLLRYEILGYAPMCFFQINAIYIIFLQFLNPLIFLMLFLITILLARLYPHLCLRVQPSPIQSMSLLMFVSSWSLSATSIQIISFTIIDSQAVPSLHPNIKYFTGEHIPLVLVSALVLFMLLMIILILCLSHWITFPRLKPFLDELQSCYADKYRWYVVVYACSWAVISVCSGGIVSETASVFITETIVIAVTLTQCIIQPYCKRWLNIFNTTLSIDLLFIIIFLRANDTETASGLKSIIIWLLTVTPLTFIALGTVFLLLHQTGIVKRAYTLLRSTGVHACSSIGYRAAIDNADATIQSSPTCQDISVNSFDEREPLISMLDKTQ